MASIPGTHATYPSSVGLSSALTTLLAAGAGLSVASIYYSQPLLATLATDLGAETGAVGWIPALTQLGYAAGIVLLAPLGDRYDRRRIILIKAAGLIAALLASSLAPSVHVLWLASFLVGLTATLAQDLVPAAATLAQAENRGKAVGKVMTGLLLGILLSRVVSGFVAEQLGWRAVFIAAAISVALIGVAFMRGLPRLAATTQLPYGALLASLGTLWRKHSGLRRAAIAQGLLAVGFSAFWSTLALMLHEAPFHLGPAAAGAFGLAGAAGALAAPLAGRFADSRGPGVVTRVGAALSALAFIAMALGLALPAAVQLWVIGVGALVFDLGVQATLIAHQTIVYGLDPAARSRLNAVLMTGVFVGMAAGGALGAQMLAAWGWLGVTALATTAAVAALAVRLWPAATRSSRSVQAVSGKP